MSNISDSIVIISAILMIVGVVSIILYIKKIIGRLVYKKEKRKAAYQISFYLNKERIYNNGFSIIPQQGAVILIPVESITQPYIIETIIYNTAKDTESSSDIDIVIKQYENKELLPY